MRERRSPRQRLDAPHARAAGAVAQDHASANITGLTHMRAAAQLNAVGLAIAALACIRAPHRHHAHFIAVFLTKERLRANRPRVIRRHYPCFHARVLPDEGIHLCLNLCQFPRTQRFGVAEIKAQPIRCIERAALAHVIAQGCTQGFVQQVGGRVVGANGTAAVRIHGQCNRIAARDCPLNHLGYMHKNAGGLARIRHLQQCAVAANSARIADLAAAFGVERRLVQRDHYRAARIGLIQLRAFGHNGYNLAFGHFGVITQEISRTGLVCNIKPNRAI